MRKTLSLVCLQLLLCNISAFAWGLLGHETVIAVAERHITERAKQNIAKYMPYDMKKDAVWMDLHRWDKEIAYTSHWHVVAVKGDTHEYDPNPRLDLGDLVLAIRTADYNLGRYEKLTDSAVVMNLRMVLHFVGDLHCPTHTHFEARRPIWPFSYKGQKLKNFHQAYDRMPEFVYGETPATEVAARIDNCKKGEIKKIQSGSFADWAKSGADRNYIIYEWTPENTPELTDEVVANAKDLIDYQLRNAGYRLALLLNKYFDK